MNQLQTVFREGVMSHLDDLEMLSQNMAVRQEQRLQQVDIQQKKRELILQLERERDELRNDIRLQNQEIQALKAMGEESRPEPLSTREIMQDMKVEGKENVLEALWFTGISGTQTDYGVCFCITTAFEGSYLDSYYLQVDHLEKPILVRNSVPSCIPLWEISKTYLQTDLKKFLSILRDQLNGYAGRKFQADRLQESPESYIPETLQTNSLYSTTLFSYFVRLEGRTSRFNAKLHYSDVTRVLPTEALITCLDDSAAIDAAIQAHSALFCREPLHRAAESVRPTWPA